jgi:hypothetical protein
MKEEPRSTNENEKKIDLVGDITKALKGSPKTDADLMRLFEQNAVEKIFHNLVLKGGIQKSTELSSALFNVEPLQAKIGKKEGVHPEKRFFVYEKREKANGEIVYDRKGILRAKRLVTDNTYGGTGDMRPTEFVRVGGTAKLEEGMLLKEKTEAGMSVAALLGFNGQSRYGGINFEFNISHLLGKRMGSGAPVGFKFGASWTGEKVVIAGENEWDAKDYTFNHFNFYLKKDIAIASIFRLGLFSGLAFEAGTNEADESESYQGLFIPVGADFGINLTPWLHTFVQAEYGFQFGDAALNDGQSTPTNQKWYDLYPERKKLHTRLGLRISF